MLTRLARRDSAALRSPEERDGSRSSAIFRLIAEKRASIS
jgi:hypothetical protein